MKISQSGSSGIKGGNSVLAALPLLSALLNLCHHKLKMTHREVSHKKNIRKGQRYPWRVDCDITLKID